MKYSLDEIHFQELASYDKEDVCRRTLCKYDSSQKAYRLPVWGDEFVISEREKKIVPLDETLHVHDFFYVFIINYLQVSQNSVPVGKWISEKDVPGGVTFFRGPHEIPTKLISDCFGNDLEKFKRKCIEQGGVPLDMGDASFSFNITPDIPLAVIYWVGDEEFPAEAKLLYDASIGDFLALDIIFAIAVEACYRLGRL